MPVQNFNDDGTDNPKRRIIGSAIRMSADSLDRLMIEMEEITLSESAPDLDVSWDSIELICGWDPTTKRPAK